MDFTTWLYRTDGDVVERLTDDSTLFPSGLGVSDYESFGGLLYISTWNGIYTWNGTDLVKVASDAAGAALAVYGGALYANVPSNGLQGVGNGLYRLGPSGWERVVASPRVSNGEAVCVVAGDLLYFDLTDTNNNRKLYVMCDANAGCDPSTVTSFVPL